MVSKRLIGVITVKDGWAVQSFAYSRYLPLGRPEILAENLDRWGADEILLLCIDRTRRSLGPDFALLRRVVARGLSTPLVYGGGVATVEDATRVIQSGAERVCVDAALHGPETAVRAIAAAIGGQALVGALPLTAAAGGVGWYDYRGGQSAPLSDRVVRLFADGVISEALVIDWRHEGLPRGFDVSLLTQCPVEGAALVAFGGVSEADQIAVLLALPRVAAVGIGNFLTYAEHALQKLKEPLGALPVRPAVYGASV